MEQGMEQGIDRQLFSPRIVAKALGVTEAVVYDACYRGEMRSVRINSFVKISRQAMLDWIVFQEGQTEARMGRRTAPAPAPPTPIKRRRRRSPLKVVSE